MEEKNNDKKEASIMKKTEINDGKKEDKNEIRIKSPPPEIEKKSE